MATQKKETGRKCVACREVTLHDLDGHRFCLKCLGSAHDPFTDCAHCEKLPQSIKDIRVALIAETLDHGRLSVDWLERLRSVENVVWSKTNPLKSTKRSTKLKNPISKETVTESESTEDENEQNEQNNQSQNVQTQNVQGTGPTKDSDKITNVKTLNCFKSKCPLGL